MTPDNIDISKQHLHVWSRTLDGAELANAVYDHEVDAAMDFVVLARGITKYNQEADIKIEDAMHSLQNGQRGMYAGSPGLIFVLSRCDGGCKSPSWN